MRLFADAYRQSSEQALNTCAGLAPHVRYCNGDESFSHATTHAVYKSPIYDVVVVVNNNNKIASQSMTDQPPTEYTDKLLFLYVDLD